MLAFFRDIAAAVHARGTKELLEFVPGGKYLYEIGADALKRRKERHAQQKLEDEVKEMVAAKIDAAVVAKQAVEAEAADLPPREKELLAQFVAGIPEAARVSLARKEDPSGRSVPAGFTLQFADDVAKLLPQSPPRFVPGDPVPGLGSWVLVKKLGGGGFGEVWLAEHAWKKTEPRAAFKFCTDAASRTRLAAHEKDLIVRVMRHGGDHPNIVPLLECSLDGPTPWLKYEYVAGGTLADVVLSWRGLTAAERLGKAVGVLHTLAGAVGHFHAMNPPIVHRDLKPANVLMATDVPRITDFGIGGAAVAARVAEERTRGASGHTPLPSLLSGSYSLLYSSPQQRNGDAPDPRDDVHALGVIAYQMLVAQLDAEAKGNWQKRLRNDGVPDALIDLIGDSVSDEVADRPTDARAWAKALTALVPKSEPKPPPATTARPHETVAVSTPSTNHPLTWPISVPGRLLVRVQRYGTEDWKEVTKTPADVIARAGEVYWLIANDHATDDDLAGLSRIRGLPGLAWLSLGDCKVATDSGLSHVCELTALTALFLNNTNVTAAGLSHLRRLTALAVLNLDGCKGATDAGLSQIRGLSALTALSLRDAGVTDVALSHLGGLISLTSLCLDRCKGVTDAGLSHVRGLTALTTLDLDYASVTDAGLWSLRGLTALTTLYLDHCWRVTDAGLSHLRGLTKLARLYLEGCSGVTDKGVAKLRKALPNCLILR